MEVGGTDPQLEVVGWSSWHNLGRGVTVIGGAITRYDPGPQRQIIVCPAHKLGYHKAPIPRKEAEDKQYRCFYCRRLLAAKGAPS